MKPFLLLLVKETDIVHEQPCPARPWGTRRLTSQTFLLFFFFLFFIYATLCLAIRTSNLQADRKRI